MNDDEFRAMAIRRAMDGDAAAARDVLDLCREGLDNNCLHADLRVYLAERITEILDGVPPGDALLVTKKPGRPKESGAWRDQLGAFAVLLHRRGYTPKKVAAAMCDQRRIMHDETMDESDAYALSAAWRKLSLDDDLLLHFAGPYRRKLSEYPPLE
jgi:hypothetical protein